MLVRDALDGRLSVGFNGAPTEVDVKLPLSLKLERDPVRTGMMKRLSSSRMFALGNRAGVLRAAENRSGRAFRLDVRQRVIVKALVSRHAGTGAARAAALAKHVAYLGRAGAGVEGERPEFFSQDIDGVRPAIQTEAWAEDRHHFRFIVSPEHGDRIDDLKDYVRAVMRRVSEDLGEPKLAWVATCHHDTEKPHAHILVRGRRHSGRDLVIPRDYMGYGFRARAQEVAQERLGDLSRVDAERRIWRETEANRFTGLDRRLLAAADPQLRVADGIGGHDAWAALTRGRLRHLERLGLATSMGRQYRLSEAMEPHLRRLQASQDIIRTTNQRRLEGALDVRPLGAQAIKGKVVKTGFHDELGAAPFVIVRAPDHQEHYARTRPGEKVPTLGSTVTARLDQRGFALITPAGRGADLQL